MNYINQYWIDQYFDWIQEKSNSVLQRIVDDVVSAIWRRGNRILGIVRIR